MAEGRITTGVLSGAAGLAAGTVLGGFLGRGGFFGEGAGTSSGIVTPGGALSADAQASLAAGGPANAPAANGAIRYPITPDSIMAWIKSNPLLAAGIGAVGVFVVWKVLR